MVAALAWWAQHKNADALALVNKAIAGNAPGEKKKYTTFEPALRERSAERRAKAQKARVKAAKIDSGAGHDGDVAAAVRARGASGAGRDGSRGWRGASGEAGTGSESKNATGATRAGLHVRPVQAGLQQRGGTSATELLRRAQK